MGSKVETLSSQVEDLRSVLVRIQATPQGLRNIASMLETLEPGQSVRVNWYTVQIEFMLPHNPEESTPIS